MKMSEVAGKQITKLLGVFQWFEWNGRKFDLSIVCEILCEPMPEVSEFERDANYGCTLAAGVIGRDWDESAMNALLDRHDEIFEKRLKEERVMQ